MSGLNRACIQFAIAMAVFGVVIHLLGLVAGPAWFSFFGAPPVIITSAKLGTWLAPLASFIIATLMAICAWYGAAALQLVRQPPLLRTGLAAMASLCLLRGLALPVLALRHPELWTRFEIIAALCWFSAGWGFAVALTQLLRQARPAAPSA